MGLSFSEIAVYIHLSREHSAAWYVTKQNAPKMAPTGKREMHVHNDVSCLLTH